LVVTAFVFRLAYVLGRHDGLEEKRKTSKKQGSK
jgi:hypothetical protein